MCDTRVESLEMDLETFSSNAMKAMEIKDKEIEALSSNFLMVMKIKDEEVAHLTAELEKANHIIEMLMSDRATNRLLDGRSHSR